MDLIANLALGLQTAATPLNLGYCFLGVLLGTLIGVLPGLGPVPTIAMLLPVTFGLPPVSALIMLAGIFYGAQYGGSTTAILINVPGESSSVVTALDGYQMARQGRAGVALATAALSSFVAGTLSTLVIAFLAPPLADVALLFGPAEYFSLMVLGLIGSVALASGSILKAMGMIVLGLLLGLVGTDVNSGLNRFTLGIPDLSDGLSFVALAMGVFGVAEIIRNLENERKGEVSIAPVGRLVPTRDDVARMAGPIGRGTLLGSLLGILPGGGALLSSFASYALEKKLSREPDSFGRGAIAGVAGPEAANNAGAQTSFIPMLTLGLPSNPVMALMIGAMMIHEIQPGPNIMREQPQLFWGLIVSMWIGNVLLLVLNLPLVGLWVRLLSVPYRLLFPTIVVFACIGAYTVSHSIVDIWVLFAAVLVGHILARLDCEPAPMILAFILGPMMEEHLRRALLMSRGDALVFVQRPISAAMLGAAILALVLAASSFLRTRRREVFSAKA